MEDLLPLLDGVAAVVAAEDPPTGSMDLELGVHPRLDRPDEHAVFDHYRDVLDRLDDIQLTRRPWLTGRIEAFLAEQPRGYFFIEGKTGVGNTTLRIRHT